MKVRHYFLAAVTPDDRLYQLMNVKDKRVLYRTYESLPDGTLVLRPSLPSGREKKCVEADFAKWAMSRGYEIFGSKK